MIEGSGGEIRRLRVDADGADRPEPRARMPQEAAGLPGRGQRATLPLKTQRVPTSLRGAGAAGMPPGNAAHTHPPGPLKCTQYAH